MRSFLYFLLIFILFFNCSSDIDVQTAEMEPLTDVLTLELSFGDENTISKDEFLLANPMGIAVNNEGDMLVIDENRIKVYDWHGKEKMIIGRPGQGPGEFEMAYNSIISPTGFLNVNASSSTFNLYFPTYEFLDMINLERNSLYEKYKIENNWRKIYYFSNIVTYSEHQRLVILWAQEPHSNENFPFHAVMIYEKNNELYEIARYRDMGSFSINNGIGDAVVAFQGEFMWDLLSNNRVIYTDTYHDKRTEESYIYELHMVSLDDFSIKSITRSYTPVEIPYSAKKRYIERKTTTAVSEFMKNSAKNTKYYPPLENLMTDRNFIFAFTYSKNDSGEILTDIFDADSGKYLRSAYFPLIPDIIKDEYAYCMKKGRDIFPVIEKYRIDPAVYGK